MLYLKKAVTIVLVISFFGCADVFLVEKGAKPGGKVAVCHKGNKTLYVDDAAVKAHLGHGDYMGMCR
ncbi:MAG: hypothetical protein HY758_03290 [Nitrospirae bacterium]|nr:hypothetical protein [Nitrospirota bacterium]